MKKSPFTSRHREVRKPWLVGTAILFAATAILCIWPFASNHSFAWAAEGASISASSESDFSKSNQSKVFFHADTWWTVALEESGSDWYIWKFNTNSATWSSTVLVHTSSSRRPDVVLDAANNRLYLFLSNSSKSELRRYSYSSSTWALDSGFPVSLSDFLDSGSANPISLVRAKSSDLWLFRLAGNKLEGKKSSNNGSSWSSNLTLKTGLTTSSGVTDGVAFTNASSENCVGVAYAEMTAAGSRFGFLVHRESDADNVWSDESSSLIFTGAEHATNELCVTVDAASNVYLLTQNVDASGSDPRNTLYRRTPAGGWQSFAINTTTAWKNPAVSVEAGNNTLYVLGINTGSRRGEYKTCIIGQESTLSSATATTLFANDNANDDNFIDLSVPAPPNFGDATSLMVCVDNKEMDDIWYNQIPFGPGSTSNPLVVGSVTVSPNEANFNASYTIPITLGSNGALNAASGTITIQFPSNAFVPSSMSASQITVNGFVASSATSNSSTGEVSVTTPISLSNDANVSVVFNSGAGLLNPSNAGNYALQARTSAEPSPASSAAYTITAATTTVTAANVTPNPNTINTAAAYTINFNLGARGRLVAGSSTITITFNNATTVSNGSIGGAQINGVSATASGNSAAKTITLTVPAGLSLGNGAAVTVSLPSSAITNPTIAGNYTLSVATSVEATNVTSTAYSIQDNTPPSGEDFAIVGSAGDYEKPNQNRPFCHDGTWWTAARKSSDGSWHLWKMNGSTWSSQVELDSRTSTRPDCYVDSPSNKLYILLASTSSSGTKLMRLSYSGGSWSIDSGFPVTLSNFTFSGESTIALTRAKNGDLWAIRYASGQIDAQKSSNGGASWSSTIVVKSGVVSSGLADAVAFTSLGENYVGVGYGENTAGDAVFGFLKHKDGDPDGSWSDETGSVPQFSNALGDDHISLAASANGEVFMICKTHPNSGSAAGIGLLKRTSNGNWQNFTIQQGGGWTRPAVVVDETNNELYVLGTEEGSPEHGQYRKCAIGNESSLQNASVVDILDSGAFNNLSVPQHRVTGAMDMLVCGENTSSGEIWYNLVPIAGGGGPTPTPLVVNSVIVNPNTAGLSGAYTIGMTLGSQGALTGGSGTITVTWPSGTTVPASMNTSAVTVNGSNASSVTTNSGARRATVTAPSNLANNASVSLAFSASAGIVNPSAGNYVLQVQTSAQPTDVNSPSYSIVAPTPLTVNNITVTPDTASRTASYSIPLTLGNTGALSAGSGTITVTWPNDTNIPASIVSSAVTVNGVNASNVTTTPASRQAVVMAPANLANNASVTLLFTNAAGLVNPTSAGNYTLQVRTSAQPTDVNSPSYAIKAPAPTPLIVSNITVTPDTVSRAASYSIPLTLGNTGALSAGSGTITVTWPNDTNIPASIASSAVTVNGVTASNVTTTPASRQAVVTMPANLANNANVTLLFTSAAGIVNPTSAGNYVLQVQTSAQPANVNSPSYAINAPAATPLIVSNITVTPDTVSRTASYSIPLTLGNTGALSAGSGTITVTWPNDTNVPASIASSAVTVNGVTASNVTTTPASRQAVVMVPANLANNANVTLLFTNAAGIVNPTSAGNYVLQVQTSAQPTNVNSPSYAIKAPAPTPLTVSNITVTPDTVSRTASYSIPLTLGNTGALSAGSGTITVTWPNDTNVPASIANTAVTVNGANASNVVTTPASRRAVVTVPANLANNASVTLLFTNAAGLVNPTSAGNYVLQVQTSAQPTNVSSPSYAIKANVPPPPNGNAGQVTHGDTDARLERSNQSKLFYLQGNWWLIAFDSAQTDWYLWRFSNGAWTRNFRADDRTPVRIDAVLDSAGSRLYYVSSHEKKTKIVRLLYSNGAWTDESKVELTGYGHGSTNTALSLARAKNGELWIFRINGSALEARVSNDNGATWSATLVLKSGINGANGNTDGLTFTSNGNRVGVFYGMTAGSNASYGFLHHRDGDANTAWSDESANLTFFGAERCDLAINAHAANDGAIYLLTQNSNTSGSGAVFNSLYVRSNSGNWNKYRVNVGAGWSSPVVGIDESNDLLYLMGVRTDAPSYAEFKSCGFGSESILETQNAAVLLKNDSDNFGELTAPSHVVYASSDLMICGGNTTRDEIWYNLVPIGGGGGPAPTPLVVNSLTVNPNTAGSSGAYTIGMTLGSQGALTGGSGTITVTWPSGTTIPGSISTSAVTVNGNNASGVTTNSGARRATVTVPSNLANNASVSLVFGASAGIVNPSAGNHVLQAQTSAQPTDVNSPSYSIEAPAPTPLTVSNVTVTPDTLSRIAGYSIPLTLGNTGALSAGSGTITVTWPNDTNVPASIANTAVTVNGANASNVTTTPASRQAVVTVPANLASNANVTLLFTSAAGLVNPTSAGNYGLQVQTSAQPTNVNSPGYAINAPAPTPLIVNNITVTPDTASRTASYSIPLTLGNTGALSAINGTITVTWPNDTNVPASIANTAVTVNGVNAANVTTAPASRQSVVTVPANLANNANVTLLFMSAAGIVNPTSAGNFVLQVQTSAQPTNVNSPSYVIKAPAATSLTVSNVTVTPDTASRTASYSIPLKLGNTGALSSGSGTITIIWPNDTNVPASIANSAVTVNGVNTANVTTTPASRQAVVTVPANLANNANVTLLFTNAAGLVNPTSAGNYVLQVQTSAQPTNVNSPAYAIKAPAATPLTVSNITVTPDTASRTASYSIPLTLGNTGALSAGSGTITVTWPNDTNVPASIANTAVTVNGVNASSVTTTPASRQAVVTVPANLANNANVTLLFTNAAGLVNPTSAGNYVLQVQTSAQPTNVNSPSYAIKADVPPPPAGNAGQITHGDTDARLERSNQSKLFYLQGSWWLIGFDTVEADWYLWRFLNGAWTRNIRIDDRTPVRIDAVLDSAGSRLYCVSSHEKKTKLTRLLYSSGSWSQEAKVDIYGFGHGSTTTALSLARAKNGELWLFRINGSVLEAKISGDNGDSWSATLALKSGISGAGGNTDALTFTANGNRVGVFYGMTAGSSASYGFLHHRDGDANTAWSDESANLTFFGAEHCDVAINAQAANDGTLYLLTQNSNTSGSGAVFNTLHARSSSGNWSKHKVNVGAGWSSPVVGIDESNDLLYLMGVRMDTPNYAEYKSCSIGSESTLETQTTAVLLKNDSDNFGELTAPSHVVYASLGLMICGGNTTTNDVWYNQLGAGFAKPSENASLAQTEIESGVAVYPNPFNPATTIRFYVNETSAVRLRIFNIRGALVRELIDQEMNSGMHERRWNGRDRQGRIAASGTYFYRLEIGPQIHQGRLEILK